MAYNFNPKTIEDGVAELITKPKVATMYGFLWQYFTSEGIDDIGEMMPIDKEQRKFKIDYSLVSGILELTDFKNNDLKAVSVKQEFFEKVLSNARERYPHIITAKEGLESLTVGTFDVGSGSRGLTPTQQENIQVLSLAWWQACVKNNLPTTLPAYQAFILKCATPPKRKDAGFDKLINELADTTIFNITEAATPGRYVKIEVPLGTGQRYVKEVATLATKDKTWIAASYHSAEKFHNSHSQLNYKSSGQYVFTHVEAKGYGWFKNNYATIMKQVKESGTFPLSQTPDANKWNPADMLAVDVTSVKAATNMSSAKTIINDWKSEPTRCLNEYNNLIKEWFDSGNLIPISLKKSSSNPKLKFMNYTSSEVDDKAFTHIMSVMERVHAAKTEDEKVEIMNKLINISQVRYDPRIQKCLVYFDIDVDGDGKQDTNEMYYFDIRGFEEGSKFSDIQVQIMPAKQAMAGLGKIAFSLADDIIKMYSGSTSHFSKLKRLRIQAIRNVCGKNKIPLDSAVVKRIEGQLNSIDRFMRFQGSSIENAGNTIFGRIDSQMFGSVRLGREILVKYVELLGGTSAKNLMREDIRFVKNKVQSYELGRFFDENKSTVNRLIRKKVLLSIYFYASSRGIFAFLDNKTIAEIKQGYFRSSPFVILGG